MFGWGKADGVASVLLGQAQQEREARKRRIGEAWQRYEGQHPKPLKPSLTDPDGRDNTTVNLARKTVDIAAFYLFGKPIAFEVGKEEMVEGVQSRADEQDAWLESCWKANRQATFLLEFATSAGVSGDGFIRIYPPKEGEKHPRLVSLDAAMVEVDWDPEDYNRVRRYLVEFNSVDTMARTVEARRHRIERDGTGWRITEEVSKADSVTWLVMGEERWPYAFAPIFHCKNRSAPHCYYGTSDIECDVLHLNGAISFVLSNINRILRVHGHPQLYIAGTGAPENVDKAIDSVLYIPSPEGKVGTVPMVTELSAHFGQLKELKEAYHELTSVPEIASGKMENVGQLSGIALQILYGPLMQLISVKRMFYGEMLVELCEALLVLGGYTEELPVTIHWPSLLPHDSKTERDVAAMDQEMGIVSKGTIAAQFGYDFAAERAKIAREQAAEQDAKAALFDRGGDTGEAY